MHILEEWKKSLAYDLKLSSRQIGISLEKNIKSKMHISCIHHQLTKNRSIRVCKAWNLSSTLIKQFSTGYYVTYLACLTIHSSWIVHSVLWTLNWPQESESFWKDNTSILREFFGREGGEGYWELILLQLAQETSLKIGFLCTLK